MWAVKAVVLLSLLSVCNGCSSSVLNQIFAMLSNPPAPPPTMPPVTVMKPIMKPVDGKPTTMPVTAVPTSCEGKMKVLSVVAAATSKVPRTDSAKPDGVLPLQKAIDLPAETYTKNESINAHDNNWTLRQGCPSDLPIADPEKKHFYGARIYTEKGGPISALACNGYWYDDVAGFRISTGKGSGLLLGTLIVHPGCKFIAFSNYTYTGNFTTFTGPQYFYNGPDLPDLWVTCDGVPCVTSYIVECGMSMPDCVPVDGWTSVAHLDNSGSSIPTKFTYQHTIGTAWSSEVSQGFNVDVSVTATIKASFFDLFSEASVSGSTSYSTGYNWQKTSSEAKSELTSFTIETDVPAGSIIQIDQAQGMCGGSEVKTEMFKHYDIKTGESCIFIHQ